MSCNLYKNSEINHLCRRCQLLLIDDKAWGGYKTKSSGGDFFLSFDEHDAHQEFPTPYNLEDPYPDLRSLSESVAAGCICCAQIREAILGLKPPEGAARLIVEIFYQWSAIGPPCGLTALLLQVDFMSITGQKLVPRVKISFDIDSKSALCIMWLRLEKSPECEPLDLKNIAWIQMLLDEYESRDTPLGIKRDNQYFPTRLLDLGNNSQGEYPRLVLATDLQSTESRLKYLTLSYCWGSTVQGAPQYRTTTEILPKLLDHIDITQTAAVVQDAIAVCKALGIRYIWIDALCIIQDDKRDWEQEAGQMLNVYRNAIFTICPLSSASCSQGFLENRSHGVAIPFRSSVSPDIGGYYTLRNNNSDPGLKMVDGNPCYHDFQTAVWSQRAWTFQEKYLSRVLLCFGKRKIYIISGRGCIHEGETECKRHQVEEPIVASIEQHIELEGPRHSEAIYHDWIDVISKYSGRQLTLPTDKFPALSGLAAYFNSLLTSDDQYVAGLWKQDLHRQLFWKPLWYPGRQSRTFDELFGPQRSSQQFIAPSWSWGSQSDTCAHLHRNFGIYTGMFSATDRYGYADYQPEYACVEPCISQSNTSVSIYGQIKHASLEITSRTRRISLPILRQIAGLPNDKFDCGLDFGPCYQVKGSDGSYLADCHLDWEHQNDDTDRELELLLLGSAVKVSEDEDEEESGEQSEDGTSLREQRYAWGLVICPASYGVNVHDTDKKHYRVGIFYSEPEDKGGLRIFESCSLKTVCLI